MKVFISWSGESSKLIAETLRGWIPSVIQAAKPYFSPNDIEKGSRWSSEIAKELDESKVCIICLTKENLNAPWIMFEAGAISKHLDKSKVCPILFGIETTDMKGPLQQFQASKFEKLDIRKLVTTINSALGENALENNILDNVFNMWWSKLEKDIEGLLSKNEKNKNDGPLRSERELIEEVLEITRVTEVRLRTLENQIELQNDLIEVISTNAKSRTALSLYNHSFRVGGSVSHEKYGLGQIVKIEPNAVVVHFDNGEQKVFKGDAIKVLDDLPF